MAFTPRTQGYGEYTRIANEVLTFGTEIDSNIVMLPWDETSDMGPINNDDLANPQNLSNNIKTYFDKPPYVNWDTGSPVCGIGIQFSSTLGKYKFMNKWNLKRQTDKQNNRAAYSISFAPSQKSPSAFIIGIAAGSTEKEDI